MAVYIKIIKNKFLGLLLTILLAASCSEPNPGNKCIYADDFGGISTTSVTVLATNSKWIDSGQYVNNGDFEIYTKGNIDICSNGVNVAEFKPIPTIGGWQDTGVKIPFGAEFEISVKGWWSRWIESTANADPTRKNWNGRELYAALGDAAEMNLYNNNVPPVFPEVWAEVENIPGFDFESPSSPTRQRNGLLKAGTPGNPLAAPPVPADLGKRAFELYNYVTRTGGFKFKPKNEGEKYIAWTGLKNVDFNGTLPVNKTLWVRFTDTTYGDNSTDTTPPADHIKLIIKYENKCPGKQGQFLQYYIGNTDPNIAPPFTTTNTDLHEAAAEPTTPPPPPPAPTPIGNGFYRNTAAGTGTIWFKIEDLSDGARGFAWPDILAGKGGDSNYGNNKGSYKVSVTVPTIASSDIVNNMVEPVKQLLQGDLQANGYRDGGLTKELYEAFITNSDFVRAVRGFLALSIIFYAYMYAFGLAQVRQKELVHHIFKMMVVIALIGPDSWSFFRNYFFTFFIEGADGLIDAFAGAFTQIFNNNNGADGPTLNNTLNAKEFTFDFFDKTIAKYFSHKTQAKLVALMFSSFVGFFLALCIWFGIILFLVAFLKAVILYLLSIIMISLLLFVAPIFIIMLLFNTTRGMFDNWIKNLISFSIQPILLFTCLAIFNAMIFSAFYQVLSFDVCYDCLIGLDFPISEYIFANIFGDFDNFCILQGYKIWSLGSDMEPDTEIARNPVAIFFVFIFLILIAALLKFLDWVVAVGNSITAGATGTDLTGSTQGAMSEATKMAKQTASGAMGVAKVGAGAVGATASVGAFIGKGGASVIRGAGRTIKRSVVDFQKLRDPNKKDLLATDKLRSRETNRQKDRQDVAKAGFRVEKIKIEGRPVTLETKRSATSEVSRKKGEDASKLRSEGEAKRKGLSELRSTAYILLTDTDKKEGDFPLRSKKQDDAKTGGVALRPKETENVKPDAGKAKSISNFIKNLLNNKK